MFVRKTPTVDVQNSHLDTDLHNEEVDIFRRKMSKPSYFFVDGRSSSSKQYTEEVDNETVLYLRSDVDTDLCNSGNLMITGVDRVVVDESFVPMNNLIIFAGVVELNDLDVVDKFLVVAYDQVIVNGAMKMTKGMIVAYNQMYTSYTSDELKKLVDEGTFEFHCVQYETNEEDGLVKWDIEDKYLQDVATYINSLHNGYDAFLMTKLKADAEFDPTDMSKLDIFACDEIHRARNCANTTNPESTKGHLSAYQDQSEQFSLKVKNLRELEALIKYAQDPTVENTNALINEFCDEIDKLQQMLHVMNTTRMAEETSATQATGDCEAKDGKTIKLEKESEVNTSHPSAKDEPSCEGPECHPKSGLKIQVVGEDEEESAPKKRKK